MQEYGKEVISPIVFTEQEMKSPLGYLTIVPASELSIKVQDTI